MNTPLPRRQFVTRTAAAMAGIAAHGFAPRVDSAPVADAGFRIVDTHTHFYDPGRPQGVPWPPKDDKLLYRRVLPANYRALKQPRPVAATVVVEASPWLEDNQWILDLAARDPFIVGFVGNLQPGTVDFPKHLERFGANPIFRGIRIGADRLRQGLGQERFRDHLRLLSKRDLALDLLGGPEQLTDLPRLAENVPDLRVVIDHVANIRIDGGEVDAKWRQGMREVGQRSNIFCKVSGLVEGTGRTDGSAPARADFYRPVLDTIWSAFGPDRLIYGSNWPVSERFAPCGVVQQIVVDYFAAKGTAPLEKVFAKNAERFYRCSQARD